MLERGRRALTAQQLCLEGREQRRRLETRERAVGPRRIGVDGRVAHAQAECFDFGRGGSADIDPQIVDGRRLFVIRLFAP